MMILKTILQSVEELPFLRENRQRVVETIVREARLADRERTWQNYAREVKRTPPRGMFK